MFGLDKIFVASFITLLVLANCEQQLVEVIGTERSTEDVNPEQVVILTQLEVIPSDLNYTIYSYSCSAGIFNFNPLIYVTYNKTLWPSPVDVERNLFCPPSGFGSPVSYFDISFSVTSPEVECFISDGGLDLGYISVSINVWNTQLFDYTALFYE